MFSVKGIEIIAAQTKTTSLIDKITFWSDTRGSTSVTFFNIVITSERPNTQLKSKNEMNNTGFRIKRMFNGGKPC